jgi:hypothetical protein
MYYLVENWQQTEMDVMYFVSGKVPNDQKWRVLGTYQSRADAWAAYRDMCAQDEILKPSSRYMRAL